MNLGELARAKVQRTGEVPWFDTLTKAQQREIAAELRKWTGPLTPFAKAVIEKFNLNRKVPIVRDTLRAMQNGKKTS